MSHGCSGDIWRVDYSPTRRVARLRHLRRPAWWASPRRRSMPSASTPPTPTCRWPKRRFRWRTACPTPPGWPGQNARRALGHRPAETTQEEVYAIEQLDSARVGSDGGRGAGDRASATSRSPPRPTETYALTGLKLKRRAPLPQTMVIELANGGDGDTPAPEQHALAAQHLAGEVGGA